MDRTSGEITELPQVVEWTLFDPFLRLNSCHISPPFNFRGEYWNLAMFIEDSGKSETRAAKVSLVRQKESAPSIKVEFSFSLKTWNEDEKYGEIPCTKVFGRKTVSSPILILLHSKRMSKLLKSGDLTLICTLQFEPVGTTVDEVKLDIQAIKSKFAAAIDPKTSGVNDTDIPKAKESVKVNNNIEASSNDPQTSPSNEIHAVSKTKQSDGNSRSGSTETLHKKRILQDLKQLFLNQEDCDVVIRVKECEFKAHRVILKARSPVFACIFRNDMKEKATGVVVVEDLDPATIPDFLCFLYCEEVESLSVENVFSLFTAADKYDVPDLRAKCFEFMKENLTVDTFCDTIRLAMLHSETELIDLSTDFFVRNAAKIITTVKWQTFNAENPVHGNELFIKYVTSNSALNK